MGEGAPHKKLKPPGRTASLLLPRMVGELPEECYLAALYASA